MYNRLHLHNSLNKATLSHPQPFSRLPMSWLFVPKLETLNFEGERQVSLGKGKEIHTCNPDEGRSPLELADEVAQVCCLAAGSYQC